MLKRANIRKHAALLALGTALLAAAPAQAETATLAFNDLSPGLYGSNLAYQGYVISPSHNFAIVSAGTPPQFAPSAFLGISQSTVLNTANAGFMGTAGSLLYIARADGLPFTLESLTSVGAQWGVSSSNSGAQGFLSSGAASFSGAEWTGVQWLQFGAGSGDFRGFDNLVLTAVPEPASGLLLLMGAAVLAAARRRPVQD